MSHLLRCSAFVGDFAGGSASGEDSDVQLTFRHQTAGHGTTRCGAIVSPALVVESHMPKFIVVTFEAL